MELSDVARKTTRLSISKLEADAALSRQVQRRLTHLGCLDPPVDGKFGPISQLSLARFADAVDLPYDDALTSPIAAALLDADTDTFLPLQLGADFASRIVRYMRRRRWFVARLPRYRTIVYVEGADKDGRPNRDTHNVFNDRRIIMRIGRHGRPVIDYNALATTEPGRFFTDNPLNPNGAARIAFGQYKAWMVGTHHPGNQPPSRHEALVQSGKLRIHRDLNKDGIRTGDRVFVGSGMGINQHSGHDANSNDVGKVSAGCLVARSSDDHKKFMRMVKQDPRYKANHGYTYMTAVIAGDDLAATT